MACIQSLQNGAASYTHSLTFHVFARVVSRCLHCGFRLPECPDMVGPPLLAIDSEVRGFPLTSLSIASSRLLMQTMRVRHARHYRVIRT